MIISLAPASAQVAIEAELAHYGLGPDASAGDVLNALSQLDPSILMQGFGTGPRITGSRAERRRHERLVRKSQRAA